MSGAARKAVSERMKAYWAKRRGQGRKARSRKESAEKQATMGKKRAAGEKE